MSATHTMTGRIGELVSRYENRDLLRFLTCGSVDDGKSTLIGRLLHDSNLAYDDQLEAARRATRGDSGEIDFSLLLDGLDAEREQGITIDVAYRYFSTEKRKFIIADTPGHEQYTRNMVTGASNCDLAIILIDARKGVLRQTRRHMFIASLLGIRHLVVAINKMDLVGYDESVFESIRASVSEFAAKLTIVDMEFIPLSALKGDNVVARSDHMDWYQGPPLLTFLENVHIASDRNMIDMRFPVQYVLRPNLDFRGYCGSVASGVVRQGQEVVVLPSGRKTTIRSVLIDGREVAEAQTPASVTITLADEVDVSRGDMIVPENNAPHLSQQIEAMLVWMAEEPLAPDGTFVIKQTTMESPAIVTDIRYRINVDDLHRQDAARLELNEIGRVRLEVPRPVAFDAYARNRQTGAFILIDRMSNATVAAGMIVDRGSAEDSLEHRKSVDAGSNLRKGDRSLIADRTKAERLGQNPVVVWLTGLPRSGKSSIAWKLEAELFARGRHVAVLDGERIRRTVSADLGFSHADRRENVRRTAEMARELTRQGLQVIVALVSQSEEQRSLAREVIGEQRLLEVFCDAPLEVCEARDTERLYARARSGEITNVTGVNFPYERPEKSDLTVPTDRWTVDESVDAIIGLLDSRGFVVT